MVFKSYLKRNSVQSFVELGGADARTLAAPFHEDQGADQGGEGRLEFEVVS